MLRRLQLLKRLQDVNLSPAEGLALMQRLETNSCRPDDYERLIKVMQATTEVSEQLLKESPAPKSSSPKRKAKRNRQVAKASHCRHRR